MTSPRQHRMILPAAAVVLALAAAVSISLLLPTLRNPDDDSVEAGFARDMSAHHSQAVEMGILAVQQADLTEIRTLGLDIALTQQAQIGMMRAWLRQWSLTPTATGTRMAWMHGGTAMSHEGVEPAPPTPGGLMPGMATPQEIGLLSKLKGPAFDTMFVDLMIRHHAGGIEMVDAALRMDPDEQVRELAESIKSGQQNEIDALTKIKTRINGTP